MDTTVFLLNDIKALSQAIHKDGIDSLDPKIYTGEVREARVKTSSQKNRTATKLGLKWHQGKWYIVSKEVEKKGIYCFS